MNIGIIHPHIKSLNHYRVLLSSGELFSIHNTQATKQCKSPVNKAMFAFVGLFCSFLDVFPYVNDTFLDFGNKRQNSGF